jgi:hypothetical protein
VANALAKLPLIRQAIVRLQESENANRQHTARSLHYRYDDDGSMIIEVRLPAETGTLVLKAVTLAHDVSSETSLTDRSCIEERPRLAA